MIFILICYCPLQTCERCWVAASNKTSVSEENALFFVSPPSTVPCGAYNSHVLTLGVADTVAAVVGRFKAGHSSEDAERFP
jgi:hypothetical protein